MSQERIRAHFDEAQRILQSFLADERNMEQISRAGDILASCLKNGGKIISCGNGGSHCDAMHFAEELSGRYRENRPALAAIAISDPSYLSCVGNDYGFDQVFSRFVSGFGRKGDVLLALSTSGNSPNVIAALKEARSLGMHTIGLTGKDGGAMATLCDIEIRAPHSRYADRAQEIHIKVIHSLIDHVEQVMFATD
ncbi:MAG: D-sedoheptulose 7-phosphate isomerase [Bacteroidetes bacterium]|nr:D-sedoheptulose 7-phosphate isomerase [Bacteroidota bacterium]